MTRIVVTSASGANSGYGALLCFSADRERAGPFSQDRRIIDPRGLSLSPAGDLVYVSSGDERVLALDANGKVVLDSGRTGGLDPGRGHSGRTAFTAEQAERWGAVAEVLPPDQVLPRAQELAEGLAAKPQLLTRYLAVTMRQRLSRRMAEAYQLGSALEGLTGADLAYQQP